MQRFLSSAPVLATIWMSVTAVILIVANRILPDMLFYPN